MDNKQAIIQLLGAIEKFLKIVANERDAYSPGLLSNMAQVEILRLERIKKTIGDMEILTIQFSNKPMVD